LDGLELYSKVEKYLDFSDEVRELHKYFLIQILENNITNVLDIGCGQGELLEIFSLNKIDGFGIDLSSSQIEFAKNRGVDAQCIDLCKLNKKFQCATATFDVVNYIPKKELLNFFKCTYAILEDDGYFIFDVNSLFGFEEVAVGTLSIDTDNDFINIDATFNGNSLITDITLFTKENNNTYTKEQSYIQQYFHTEKFLKKTLKDAGFKIEKIDKFHLHSEDESDKLIYICRKLK
jgi:cyclopropane fatty-acyl-phospholipid synthase-like methyltransferase